MLTKLFYCLFILSILNFSSPVPVSAKDIVAKLDQEELTERLQQIQEIRQMLWKIKVEEEGLEVLNYETPSFLGQPGTAFGSVTPASAANAVGLNSQNKDSATLTGTLASNVAGSVAEATNTPGAETTESSSTDKTYSSVTAQSYSSMVEQKVSVMTEAAEFPSFLSSTSQSVTNTLVEEPSVAITPQSLDLGGGKLFTLSNFGLSLSVK